MFCRTHNELFLSEVGCHKCRVSWEDGPWETKEKEWLNKLDEIQVKAQQLANHAAGLEVDNKSLKRALNTTTKAVGVERQAREEAEATATRQETKLKAIGLGYRNALEREGDLQFQLEAVSAQRGEWMERCRLHEQVCSNHPCTCKDSDISHIDRDYLIERLREKGLMDEVRQTRGWVGHGNARSWEVHDSECPVWLNGEVDRCNCSGGQTNYNHPLTKQIITGYPAPGDRLQFHCRGCAVWSPAGSPCDCEHCIFCGEEECLCDKEGEHL